MKVMHDLSLKQYNSYRLTSFAKTAYFPETKEEVITLFSDDNIANKFIIGGGYNLVLTKSYYPKTNFVILRENYSNVKISNNRIYAETGSNLKKLSMLAYESGLRGLEYFYDIPGTLGGALVMNAGSKGEDIGSLVYSLSYLDLDKKEVFTIDGASLKSSYRKSIFQDNPNLVVLDAVLELPIGDKTEIFSKMVKNKNTRWEKQPRDLPNAGSVFKRPPGYYVGQMIEELGLKGYSIGGAKVSEKHAGFIVNYNNASGKDILNLINFIKIKVLETYNIELEVEQRIL